MNEKQVEEKVKPALPEVPMGPIVPTPAQAAFLRSLFEWQERSERSFREDNKQFGGDQCWYCQQHREQRSPNG